MVLLIAVLALGGCGGEVERARTNVEAQVERARTQVEGQVQRTRERFDRVRRRIEKVFADLQQTVPQARRTDPQVRSRGRTSSTTIEAFLDDVLVNIDDYWTKTFAAAGLEPPRVARDWIPPQTRIQTACGPAGDDAAYYCPVDDTIYVAQVFAAGLYNGVLRGLPGERAGYGHAAGDFAVAYVLAHEYAHNVQQEAGVLAANQELPVVKPIELQADCLAGTWANSTYKQGLLEPGDFEEMINTALAVGDFDFGRAQHHGTPEERAAALQAGFRSGDPSTCNQFLPA
jgi:predicted metalloprotease